MKKSKFFMVVFPLAFLALTNCAKKNFAINPEEKAKALDNHIVDDQNGGSTPTDNPTTGNPPKSPTTGNPPKDDGKKPTTNVPTQNPRDNDDDGSGPGYVQQGTKTVIDVVRWCRGRDGYASVEDTNKVTVKIVDGGTTKCQVSGAAVKTEILSKGQITLANCNFSSLSSSAKILVTDDQGKTIGGGGDDKTTESGETISKLSREPLEILYRSGYKDKSASGDPLCDKYNGSPLYVDMRPQRELSRMFALSSPRNGILFDILGENSNPAPYTKKLISQVKSPLVMALVLPNERGEVTGVDQLFGDNTKGPDGEFADNGFAALAKFDAYSFADQKVHADLRDQVISEDDEVFSRLRLWSDKNGDGVAQKKELIKLKDAGIEFFDLQYDAKYYKRDKHGNEFKYKSVVQIKSRGKRTLLRPVFDVWFVIDETIQ